MNKCLEKRVAKVRARNVIHSAAILGAQELQKLQDGSTVVTAAPREDDLRLWDATIAGPVRPYPLCKCVNVNLIVVVLQVDSPYEGGVFRVSLPLPVLH